MELTFNIDRYKIGKVVKSTVTVNSDVLLTAYECRATPEGSASGRGVGYNLISDVSDTSGVCTLSVPSKNFQFQIDSTELAADGTYKIVVYASDSNHRWNDKAELLLESSGQNFQSSDGGNLYVYGTDDTFTSAFTGAQISSAISQFVQREGI